MNNEHTRERMKMNQEIGTGPHTSNLIDDFYLFVSAARPSGPFLKSTGRVAT